MEMGIIIKISIFFCFIFFLQVDSIPLQNENEEQLLIDLRQRFHAAPSLKNEPARIVARRSTDWSKKVIESEQKVSSEVPEQSENVEVTTTPTHRIRRIRIHQGAQKIRQGQDAEELRGNNPESKTVEGGLKVVRVKKFKRKPTRKTTTVKPEITTTATQVNPYTEIPKVVTDAGYSHITVINKEIKSPKRNKKRKNKSQTNPVHPSVSYDSQEKQNEMTYVTTYPDLRYSDPRVLLFNRPTSYPDYGGYYPRGQPTSSRNEQGQLQPSTEFLINQHYTSPMYDPHFSLDHVMTWTPQPLMNTGMNIFELSDKTSSGISRKQSEQLPSYYHSPYFVDAKAALPNNEGKETKKLLKQDELLKSPESSINEGSSEAGDQITGAVPLERSGNSVTAVPTVSTDNAESLAIDEQNSNKTDAVIVNPELVNYPRHTQIPVNQNIGDDRSVSQRYPSRYPNFLYDQQNGFADPFFNTQDMHTPNMQHNRQVQPLMPSLHHPFSPFYSPNDPQSEEYIFANRRQPYQSGGMVIPGFHHSPQLSSLRRSILDEPYGDETTTSVPVTAFSLPKFEMPSIDFNDKGCQTVYKEVESVPGERSNNGGESAKSFVISRECYFPNGIPTADQTKDESTEAPKITEALVSNTNDTKLDS